MPAVQGVVTNYVWRFWLIGLVYVGLLMHADLVLAQGGSAPPTSGEERSAIANERFEAGATAYKEGRYREAIELFREADTLAPSAPLSFNIAQVYERMNDGRGALAWYRDYIRRDSTGPRSAEVAQRVRELEIELQRMGVQQITVLSDPAGATVVLDGTPRGVTPYTTELPPGEHELTLQKGGFESSTRAVHLPAHQAVDVRVRLVPKSSTGAATAPAESQPPAQPQPEAANSDAANSDAASPERALARDASGDGSSAGPRVSLWTWSTLGASVALLGAAGALELSRRSLEDKTRDTDEQLAFDRRYDAMDRRQTWARVSAGAGLALAALGGALLYVDLMPASSEAHPGNEPLALGCGPTRCSLRGSF